MCVAMLLAVAMLLGLSQALTTSPHVDTSPAGTAELSTSPPDEASTTPDEASTTPDEASTTPDTLTLVTSIAVPTISVLGIVASTAVACFTHFKKKRETKLRVLAAKKRAQERMATQDNQNSQQDKTLGQQEQDKSSGLQQQDKTSSGQ